MKTGAQLIAEERQRQISAEGWTSKNDDGHHCGEMVQAAICYADYARGRGWLSEEGRSYEYADFSDMEPFIDWPDDWDISWFKPKNPIRDLVKAGALIAAEIDRLQRKQSNEQTTQTAG